MFLVIGETRQHRGENPRGEGQHVPPGERHELLHPDQRRVLDHTICKRQQGEPLVYGHSSGRSSIFYDPNPK